jgi:hypothetical protein
LNTLARRAKDLNPKIDDDVDEFLYKSVAKEPTERFRSAREMKEALSKLERQDY